MDYRKDITEYIELEREVLSKLDVDALNEAMQLFEVAYSKGKFSSLFQSCPIFTDFLFLSVYNN